MRSLQAYGDPEIVAMMGESTDANVKNILANMTGQRLPWCA